MADNTICISPVDDKVKLMTETIYVINEFKKLGFNKRGAFISVVQNVLPEFNDYQKATKLEPVWLLRVWDAELLEQLKYVLETLKAE